MALNVDTSKIDDEKVWFEVSQETLDKEKKKNSKRPIIGNTRRISDEGKTYQMKAEVNMIILLTMNIGMNEITEKNYNKFYNRIHLLENKKILIYNENDKVIHKDGTELIIIGRAFASPAYNNIRTLSENNNITYKCFSLTTQNIVNINEKEIKCSKKQKQ